METKLTPRAIAKREQIRSAAKRLFLRDGFADTSTDALAAAAGVSKQTLYAYYASKEALLSDVVQEVIRRTDETALPGRKDPPRSKAELRRQAVALARNSLEQLMEPEYLALLRVVATETPRFPHLAELFRKSAPERVLSNIAALLAEADRAGLLKVANPRLAARMLIGPLLSYVVLDGLLVPEEDRKQPPPREIERIVDLFLASVAVP